MRKTTIISPCVRAQKAVDHFNSTDYIRVSTSEVFRYAGRDPHQVPSLIPEELRPNEDTVTWIGTKALIMFLHHRQEDALIEGIAIPPTGVRELELQYPDLKVRAAFVGYSKPIEFQNPVWTPELENLIETAIGKEYLENVAKKKRDWVYRDEDGKPSPYNDSEEAGRIKDAVETIRRLGRENFKYFDLIDYIPRERRGEDPAILRLEDHVKIAIDIRSFLLKQPPTETGQRIPRNVPKKSLYCL